MYIRQFLAASILLLTLANPAPLHAAALDSTLFTTYDTQSPYTSVVFSVCGTLPQAEGCFSGGFLGPFGLIGGMIEGNPKQNLKKGTVTRNIYVVDVASGSGGNDVAHYVYKRVDTITPSDDSASTTLTNTVPLPVKGGSGTFALMAANGNFLFIGTSKSGMVAIVKKSNLEITQYGNPGIPLDSITADRHGYVTIELGSAQSPQFQVIGPNGEFGETGTGTEFMVNTVQGTVPSSVVPH
jgi:hypothetical protein